MTIQRDMAENAAVLQTCALFKGLDQADREVLAKRAYRQGFRAGDLIFRFGDPGDSMMAILLGTVRISRPTSQGREIILGDLHAGEILGEMAVLDGNPRSAEAKAVTNCEVLVLERREMMPFLESHPKVCLLLLSTLCAKIRLSDERTSDVGFASLPVRVAKTILRLAAAGRHTKLALSQSDLADMVGATRESVNRQLRAWHEEGVIELKRGWIVIADADALAATAASG